MSEINTNEIELLAIEFRNRQAIKKTPRAKIFRHKLKEIENILNTDYSIKKFVDELNRYGYEITLSAFKNDLYRARQQLKSKTTTVINEQLKVSAPVKNSQSIEPPKQNTELSVASSKLSSDEIAKSYFVPKPLFKNKNTNTQPEQEQEPEIKKHLSLKEKAELRIAELGINTETRNPFKKTTKG